MNRNENHIDACIRCRRKIFFNPRPVLLRIDFHVVLRRNAVSVEPSRVMQLLLRHAAGKNGKLHRRLLHRHIRIRLPRLFLLRKPHCHQIRTRRQIFSCINPHPQNRSLLRNTNLKSLFRKRHHHIRHHPRLQRKIILLFQPLLNRRLIHHHIPHQINLHLLRKRRQNLHPKLHPFLIFQHHLIRHPLALQRCHCFDLLYIFQRFLPDLL